MMFVLRNFQEVESVFDVMELEDEERKDLLKMEDAQMAVCYINFKPFESRPYHAMPIS